MGYSIAWLAVRIERADRVIASLSLARTGTHSDDPESTWATAQLTSGWQLIWCKDYGSRALRPDRLATLSVEQDVLICRIEEHVMASSAELWSGGRLVWSISHEGEDGPVGLEVAGHPPGNFDAIRRELEATQEAEGGLDAGIDHIFDIPLQVACSIVGFKHDESYEGAVQGRFEALTATGAKRGLLSRLFG